MLCYSNETDNYRPFKAIADCPSDSSSSRTARRVRLRTQCATPRSAQNWLRASCPDFITKDQWSLTSPDMNPMDYHVWGAMLKAYRKLKTKPKTIAKLKQALQIFLAICHRNRSTKL